MPTSIASAGQNGQPAVVARPEIIAAALDAIEHGQPDKGRRLLREHLRGVPAEACCPFLVVAATELFQGRPHVARRHLLAAQERAQ